MSQNIMICESIANRLRALVAETWVSFISTECRTKFRVVV